MTDTPAAPTTPDTDTALRTADVLWSALRDRLEPEEHIGYGRLYEQMYSWMLDKAEARSTPAEALPNDHACDWPGCAGQCHTGSTCPCHPEFESLGKHQQLTPRVMRGSSRGGRDAQGNHPR